MYNEHICGNVLQDESPKWQINPPTLHSTILVRQSTPYICFKSFDYLINMYCIETQNLTYKFSEQETVLKNINLLVPESSVYGFLGPNGAGKTTTLRLILGLLRKQAGTIQIFNKSFDKTFLFAIGMTSVALLALPCVA